ncbi:hypothetical protein Tco_1371134 [Tanacetum coccineum]
MSFRVATLRALVHAGDKTSGDARSWHMISGDAKSRLRDCSTYIHCHIAQLCVINKVPVLLPGDPYVAVRQAQLVDTYTESDPEEAPSEAEESQLLGSRVPLMSEEFAASEPSGTRTVSSHSPVSSDSTIPLSLDHPLTHVSPTPTPTRVLFHRRTARMAVCTQSTLSLGMKRYRGTSELILDTDSEGDELREEDTEEDESSDIDDERERVRLVGFRCGKTFGVATLRAVVHAGDKTSGDARSWCVLIKGKGWFGDQNFAPLGIWDLRLSACHAALAVLHDALRALVDMLLVAMLIEDVSLVMSTPAYVDSETITQADGAQSSRVPVPLPDDPYVAVRQA